MFFVIGWWFVSARKWFKGPRINVEHHMMGRDEVVEGIEHTSSSDGHSMPDKKAELGEGIATAPAR